jgi:uncharacterized protein YjbI with pentapeptide repeats
VVMKLNGNKIEPGADLSGVKMKKVVRCLVVAFVFLAGCGSSGSNGTTTTVAQAVTAVNGYLITEVNGYKIAPGADLQDANLTGVNLYCAFPKGAIFEGADLSGANLELTGLSSADLKGAKLDGARMPTAQTYLCGH